MSADYAIRDEYIARYPALAAAAAKLQLFLKNMIQDIPRIDSVAARAKDPNRYFLKAVKTNEDGSPKYKHPLYEIQDQIGARINVLYLSDVELLRSHLIKFMNFIEETPKSPVDDEAFGYVGHHFIFETPDDIIPDERKDDIPQFFELQIKTLFQHAWSETSHDIGYKAPRELTSDERRQMAFTAAQAWGADKIFEELSQVLISNDNEPTSSENTNGFS
jgi:putative GTP pyrophosphokinase